MFVRFAILAILLTLVLCKYRQESNEVVEGIKWRLPKCKTSNRSGHLQRVLEIVKHDIEKKKKSGPRYSCNLQKRAPSYKYINEKSCYFKTLSASNTFDDNADKIVSKIYNASSKILIRLENKTDGKFRKGRNKPVMPAFGCAGIGDEGTHTVCLFALPRYGIRGCQLNLTEEERKKLKRNKKRKKNLQVLLKKEDRKKKSI